MRSVLITCGTLVVALAAAAPGAAGGVVGWRTDGTGRYPDATPPIKWSPTSNVVWRTPMPDWSNATPVIVGDRLFVCSEPATLVCVSLTDGKILWQRSLDYKNVLTAAELAAARANKAKVDEIRKESDKLGTEAREVNTQLRKDKKNRQLRDRLKQLRKHRDRLGLQLQILDIEKLPRKHNDNGYSSPTPVSDGENVFVLFSTGVVACFDMNGNRKWARLHEKPTAGWGHSTSPVLVGGKLIVHVLDLVALDPATGKELWRTKSRYAYGTPAVTRIGDTDVVITPGGDIVRVSDGEILAAKVGKLTYATPVIKDGVVYFIEKKATAAKLPDVAGETIKPQQLWTAKIKGTRHYASAVVHDGLIYAVSREEYLNVLDAATGEVLYERKMNMGKGIDSAYPSVTLAGKYIYVGCQEGVTVVLAPGRTYKEVARNSLEKYRSSPVFIGSKMYLRCLKNLYCIGEKR